MRLITGPVDLPDPSEAQVLAVLEGLNEDVNSFAILSLEDQTYIQTALTPNGFVVEYREGSEESHRESTEPQDLKTVKTLFLLYHKQDQAYKSVIQYKPWDTTSPSLFDVRLQDVTMWGWLVAILYLVVMLAVFTPVAYWIATVRPFGRNGVGIALMLVPLFFGMTVIVLVTAQALAKILGISLFRRKMGGGQE